MKLIEIFEPEITKDRNIPKIKKPMIGSGVYSNVYNDDDEHMITKQSNRDQNYDPYWDYVNRLIKTEVWKGNPFFPRIYSIKKYANRYEGTMEKLTELKDIDVDMLKQYILSLFNEDLEYIFNQNSNNIMLAMNRVGLILERIIINNENTNKIKNESLIEAVKWFQNNLDYIPGDFDLHYGNMMFRRGGTGIQLVFTDPVA